MATPPPSPQHLSVQEDDVLWTEYLKLASVADARLVKDWTKVIDVLLVFVGLFSAILTAFIIQTANNFQPQPAEVTNKILIAIYKGTMNASMPIDLEKFLTLDDNSRRVDVYQNWLLYTSLTISVLVAALAMAAKLWIFRYSREVVTSGTPHARAKWRQEIHNGLLAWRLEYCIDAMPVMSLIAVILFGLFIQSSTTVREEPIAFLVGVIFEMGIAFIVIASTSAAFIFDSPYRSPFSDFIKFIFRIYPTWPIRTLGSRLRTIGIIFVCVGGLAASAFLAQKHHPSVFLPCLYYATICVYALMQKGEEKDIRPRLVNLPLLILLPSIIGFLSFVGSFSLVNYSTLWFSLTFMIASAIFGFLAWRGIEMSKTRPKTVDAEAVSWLLKTSSNIDPAWFQKAVEIAGKSHNTRALLLEKLLPLLSPLITSLPETGPRNVTPEQKGYIIALANLMEFNPQPRSFWHNQASLKRPTLSDDLISKLRGLETCFHINEVGGTARCIEACVGNAVKRILRHCESVQGSGGLFSDLAFRNSFLFS